MESNSFRLKALLYAIFVGLCAFGFVWTLPKENILVTRTAFLILWGVGIYLLFRLNTQYQKDVHLFIDAINYKDDIMIFDKKGKENFQPLYQSLNNILKDIKQEKIRFEAQKQYFEYALENIAAGVVAIDEQDEIEVFNLTAYQLLGFNKCPKQLSELETKVPNISSFIKSIDPNQQAVFQYSQGLKNEQLLFQHGLFKLEGKTIRLYTFQNIQPELALQEVKSWQKLIKTLRHEIINSISPIALLSSGLLKSLDSNHIFKNQEPYLFEEIQEGLYAIQKRSKGLQDFISAFKNISDLKNVNKEEFEINFLLERIKVLSETNTHNGNKTCKIQLVSDAIKICADSNLIEQVLLNLIKNAKEASNNAVECLIKIEVTRIKNNVKIQITDNGIGVPDKLKEHIFVPFFTNKEMGTGIGLAFAKMVMQAHNGFIELIKTPKGNSVYTGASFLLTFKQID